MSAVQACLFKNIREMQATHRNPNPCYWRMVQGSGWVLVGFCRSFGRDGHDGGYLVVLARSRSLTPEVLRPAARTPSVWMRMILPNCWETQSGCLLLLKLQFAEGLCQE